MSAPDDARYSRYSRLAFDLDDAGVMTVTLGTGPEVSSIDAVLHRELSLLWDDVDADRDVRAVVLRGPTPAAFLLGGAADYAATMANDADARYEMLLETRRIVYGIVNCSKPLVAAVAGQAVGEGVVIALLADISVVGPSTTLCDRHVPLGVAAGDHAALIWPLLCGMAKTKYHILLGEPVTGRDAERLGLVSQYVEADADVLGWATAIATRLAQMPAAAVALTKYSLNNWLRSAGPAFDASLALEIVTFGGSDFRETIARLQSSADGTQ